MIKQKLEKEMKEAYEILKALGDNDTILPSTKTNDKRILRIPIHHHE